MDGLASLDMSTQRASAASRIGHIEPIYVGNRLADHELVQKVVDQEHGGSCISPCPVHTAVKVGCVDDVELGFPDICELCENGTVRLCCITIFQKYITNRR